MDPVKNFVEVTLAAGITNVATTMTLVAGQGAKLPAVSFNSPIWDSTLYPTGPQDDPNAEIVRVTNISTDTLTITRGQEGTAAAAHNTAGSTYKFGRFLTKKDWDDIISGQGVYAIDSGAVNAYVVNPAEYPSTLVAGMKIEFKPLNTNTGASTVNVNSTGVKTIVKGGSVALAGGEMVVGSIAKLTYDGTNWVLGTSEYISVKSSVKTPSGSNYMAMTGNKITLTPGRWEIDGYVLWDNDGTTPSYGNIRGAFYAANGADSASVPTALSAPEFGLLVPQYWNSAAVNTAVTFVPKLVIVVTANTDVYLVPDMTGTTTASHARVTTYTFARRAPMAP